MSEKNKLFDSGTSSKDRLKVCLENSPKRYAVWENHWYYAKCIKICDTFTEALSYLGFNDKEEYLKDLEETKKSIAGKDNYTYFSIAEIDLIELVDEAIETEIDKAIYEKANAIATRSTELINGRAKILFEEYKEELLKTIKNFR
jgi:hypothetical protein